MPWSHIGVIPLLWHGLFMLHRGASVVLGVPWASNAGTRFSAPMLLVLLHVLVLCDPLRLDRTREGFS